MWRRRSGGDRPRRPGLHLPRTAAHGPATAILDIVGDLMSPHSYIATSNRDDLRRARPAGRLRLLAPRQQGRDLHRGATTRSLCRPYVPVAVPGADVAQRLAGTPRAHSPASMSVRGSTDGFYRLAAPLTARKVRSSIEQGPPRPRKSRSCPAGTETLGGARDLPCPRLLRCWMPQRGATSHPGSPAGHRGRLRLGGLLPPDDVDTTANPVRRACFSERRLTGPPPVGRVCGPFHAGERGYVE